VDLAVSKGKSVDLVVSKGKSVDLAVSLALYNILHNINFDFTFSVSKMKEKLEV